MKNLIESIRNASTIVLSTHKQCDGDGLGAQLGLFHALKKINKSVSVVNVDATPRKYRYLEPEKYIQYFDSNQSLPEQVDLTLIFDTNDCRLVEPLYSHLLRISKTLAFVDHHPVLKSGPKPTKESLIDTTVASTGELAFKMIKELGIALDPEIAVCLYTSITFDTQLYRFIRNSPNSHRIAAELIEQKIPVELVHRHLFGHQTAGKMAFLAKALAGIEYHAEGQLALLRIKESDLAHHGLEPDDSRDVIDMLMNIETLEAAALLREDSQGKFKLSLRSKGKVEVGQIAESFGGGGHIFSAGAYTDQSFEFIKTKVVSSLTASLLKKTS